MLGLVKEWATGNVHSRAQTNSRDCFVYMLTYPFTYDSICIWGFQDAHGELILTLLTYLDG